MHPQERGLVASIEEAANRISKVGLTSVSHDGRDAVEGLADAGLEGTALGRLETLELTEGLAVEAQNKPVDDSDWEHEG